MKPTFRQLKLGYASASDEGTKSPELLLEGYFNVSGVFEEARDGDKFLFLGNKGSGKTSLAEHLRLSAEKDSNLFVKTIFIEDMPFSDFKKIIKGSEDTDTKYPTAWSWILLLYLFGSFFEDQGSPSLQDREFFNAVEILIDTGLLPTPSLKQLVTQSSKNNFKLQIPLKLATVEIGREKTTQVQDIPIPFFVDRLKAIAEKFQSDSRHILVLDGLDDILSKKQVQYESLSALIFEVSRLNAQFYRSHTPVKIIVLCRTDLYEKLPGANKNKIKQDSAEIFDWFQTPNNPKESNLIKMVNTKVKVGNPEIEDVFAEYFPPTWPGYYEEEDIRSFLLGWTRHTPRDLIQLLKYIQKLSDVGIITTDQIWNGIRAYSNDYFLPEIKDEMSGFVSTDERDETFKLIISLRQREFSYSTLSEMLNRQPHLSSLDVNKVLGVMFECSAIGNTTQRGNQNRYSFKYRNRHDSLNLNERLIVHRGLWKAMNIG